VDQSAIRDGQCWDVVRDAYHEMGGIDLPSSYYEAAQRFTQVSDGPLPWDVVMLRTNPRAPILVLHSGLAINDEMFLHVWDHTMTISLFNDPRWRDRIAGILRLFR
jgi:cell wall-associated NlpC family hydrolase